MVKQKVMKMTPYFSLKNPKAKTKPIYKMAKMNISSSITMNYEKKL
jgi:hypothetical protein